MASKKKSGRSYFNYDSFKWSQREYSLKELLDTFGHRLPLLMLVTQGHMGRDESMHCIGADEVYWLRQIAVQPRVVVKSLQENYFSIPRAYNASIIPYTSDGTAGKTCTIAQMLDLERDYKMFEFREDVNQEVYDGAGLGTTYKMGVLEIIDVYDERFLMVHPILLEDTRDPAIPGYGPSPFLCKGPLYPLFTLIPVYMPIAVAIAVAMAKGSERTFYKTMLDMNRCVKDCKDDYSEHLKKVSVIMLFDGKPPKGDYEYIHFLKFVRSIGSDGVESSRTYRRGDYQAPVLNEAEECRTSNRYSIIGNPYDVTRERFKGKVAKVFTNTLRMIKGKTKKPPPRRHSYIPRVSSINKDRAPTPPPSAAMSDDEKYDDDGDKYEIIPMEYFTKSDLRLEPLALKDRIGPVALGVAPEKVLDEMHKVFISDALPMLALPDEENTTETSNLSPKINLNRSSIASKPVPPLPQQDFEKNVSTRPKPTPKRSKGRKDQQQKTLQISPKHVDAKGYELTELDQYEPPSLLPDGSNENKNTLPVPSPRGSTQESTRSIQWKGPIGTRTAVEGMAMAKTTSVPLPPSRNNSQNSTTSSESNILVNISTELSKSPTLSANATTPDRTLRMQPQPQQEISSVIAETKAKLRRTQIHPSSQSEQTATGISENKSSGDNEQSQPALSSVKQLIRRLSKMELGTDDKPSVAVVKPQPATCIPETIALQPEPLEKSGSCSPSMNNVIHGRDIPKDVTSFTIFDVSKCLDLLGLASHAQEFEEAQIDGSFLLDLDQHILTEQFNFSIFDARKVMRFIDGWRPG